MPGLSRYDPCWENVRAQGDETRVYEDDTVLIATDFEGGNGTDVRRLERDRYALALELEPGGHDFSGKSYYVCFGIRNKRAEPRSVRVQIEAFGWDRWGEQTGHFVLRRDRQWSQLDPAAIHLVEGMLDAVEIVLLLPGTKGPENTLFVSNFHWWPYSERIEYIRMLDGVRVREIGRSFQDRPIYAVEVGREDGNAPCMVQAQTLQPSEMGHLACRAMIDYLCSDDPEAAAICDRFRVCFIPATNPDGAVLGYAVSDAQGRMPCFEGHLAASGDPEATPETVAVWRYLQVQRPWLYWEWHSNNWARRPGHMVYRYRPYLMEDATQRQLATDLGDRLLTLPDTHLAMWFSPTEGHHWGTRLGLYAMKRLGTVTNIIKQHDKYPLERSRSHAIACLETAAAAYRRG